ncbi:aminoglycoside phosphotransferase family protein [Streptomyces sp. NPDC059104]|uniref:aminoglycoside phosphotransferase family protein n=1 Tax=Streptomyces sp. NPDC059104 TaxID=3346729 RepID=UPI003681A5D3
MIEIPKALARGTVAREGRAGADWLASLPGLAEELLTRWDLTPTAPALHGQVAIVIPVRVGDGSAAVLKISFPHPGNAHEPDAFAAWAGRGAVLLYRRDDALFAMLLETAGQDTLTAVARVDDAVAAAGRLARRLATPAPAAVPRLRDAAGQWEQELRDDEALLRHPLPRRVVDAAAATLRELGVDQPETLVHGDLHFGNILRAEREPWLAIDPKGYAGDPAYDTITLLRGRPEDFRADPDPDTHLLRRLAVFSEAAEIDPERSRRWAQARAVQASLWGRKHGDPDWVIGMSDRIANLLA